MSDFDEIDEIDEIDALEDDEATSLVPSDPVGALIDQTSSELNELLIEAQDLSSELSSDPSTALVAVTGKSPVEVKRQMAVVRADVMKKKQQILVKQEELKDLLERKMNEVLQVVGPLNAMVKRLEEGIWTANLYLGRDEVVTQLRDGEPAPAATPLSVRQLVLAMDEECAISVESGGIDAMDIDKFDEWLLEDEAHLNQIFPEQRGIIALVPRWSEVDYGNPWESAARNQENHQTYFLIRNGERLYRYVTDFVAGERLVPTASEFTDFFYEHTYSWSKTPRKPLEPGTDSWNKAEAAADARKRHYMRVGLIFQGLVDRTTVFHPLPGTVRFLEADDYDEGRIVIIADGDFLLADGRESFRDWQRRLMQDIRPGMRIIGAFDTYESRESWVLQPKHVSSPDSFTPHIITERVSDRRLKFTYDRTDAIWGYHEDPDHPGYECWGPRPSAKRASCTFYIDNNLVLPFDLIDVADIKRFLGSRTERHQYVKMFPLLKAVLRSKKDEAEQEAPFRLMLAGLFARDLAVTIEEATLAVPALVEWYKLTNRSHRPLIGTQEDNAKAVRMLTDEYRRRLEDAKKPIKAELVATLHAAHPTALMIARARDGHYVVLEPQDTGDTFVIETAYSSRGVLKERLEWQLVGTRPARWVVAYASEAFNTWNTMAEPRATFSGPEIEVVTNQLVEKRTVAGHTVVAVMAIDGTRGNRHHATVLSSIELDDVYRGLSVDEYWDQARAHPLTASYHEPDVTCYTIQLARNADGTVSWSRAEWGVSYPTASAWPCWEPTGQYNKGWRQVRLCDAVVDEITRARETYEEIRIHADALERTVYDLEALICKQYTAAAERKAYEDFIEEYRDPELWEGHRKTLRLKKLEPGRRDFDELENAMEILVEAGHVLNGLSVGEVIDHARELYGFSGEAPSELVSLVFDNIVA